MTTKTVSQLDATGVFVSAAVADLSPLEEGVWLLPGGCVDAAPPDVPAGKRARFVGGEFVLEDKPSASVAPLPTVSELRELAWGRIKAERDRRTQNGGYQVAGKWFHSDLFSRTQQLGLVIAGANAPAVQWKTMDGSFVAMTPQLAAQIFAAAAASDIAIFAAALQHKAAMEAGEDPAAYDFSDGWPVAFGEA